MDFEVVGVRICRMDGGMVDNIMMASAGQGGAGLRGDQYYPPPPPPPRFPPPFPSHILSPSFLLPALHHHRRLHPTTVDLLSLPPPSLLRLLVLLDVSRLTNRIARPARRASATLDSPPTCVYACVCACVRKRTCRVHMWPSNEKDCLS